MSGYSATRIQDDLSYYDEGPHVIVDDRYYVEPSQTDVFWQSPPPSIGHHYPALTNNDGPHSASLQVHSNARF